jgi:hypothetical protein
MDVSPDRAAYPYQMGHGRPLDPPTSSSMRNPQSATRSMGVAETSPSVPRRDGEGALKTSRRALPDRLERAQARGLDARASPKPAGTSPMPVETCTTPTDQAPR